MTVEAVTTAPVADLIGLHRTALAVREHVLAIGAGPIGTHIGGALSAVDILVTLYREVLRVRPDEPNWPGRDHFVLSKGHASAALYATLAECGFFPVEELATYGLSRGRLMAHPTPSVPGVEFATGSLGHGLALGAGLALAAKRAGRANRVFVLMGDGELQEGSVWEAAMAAAHYKLDNLTAIVDRNRLQISGSTEDRMRLEPLADKWRAFGWQCSDVDGHDFGQLVPALCTSPTEGRPAVLIADTVKGRGVRHLQHRKQSHFAKLGPEAYERALTALRSAA
jgi:transketolase